MSETFSFHAAKEVATKAFGSSRIERSTLNEEKPTVVLKKHVSVSGPTVAMTMHELLVRTSVM